jgi:long-chain acyl-CoA synthetase
MEARRWHRSYPTGMPHDITIDEAETLVSMLERAIAEHAGRTSVTCLGESFSYADIGRLSLALASYLRAIDLQPGDRVAVMLPSCAPFVVALTGVLRASMALVTINPLYTPREVEHQLADSGANLIIAAEPLLPTLLPLLPRTAVRQILHTPIVGLQAATRSISEGEHGASGSADATQACSASQMPIATALQIGATAVAPPAAPAPSDPAFLQYTGGTTGESKGAVLTHRSVCASLRQMMSWMCLSLPATGASIVTPLPMYHVYPLAVSLLSLALGANNRLIPNPRDLASVIAEMKRGPFSMFIGVNTLFNALVDAPELTSVDFSATRLVTGAGASVQGAVALRWEAAGGPPITEGYGLTETSAKCPTCSWFHAIPGSRGSKSKPTAARTSPPTSCLATSASCRRFRSPRSARSCGASFARPSRAASLRRYESTRREKRAIDCSWKMRRAGARLGHGGGLHRLCFYQPGPEQERKSDDTGTDQARIVGRVGELRPRSAPERDQEP